MIMVRFPLLLLSFRVIRDDLSQWSLQDFSRNIFPSTSHHREFGIRIFHIGKLHDQSKSLRLVLCTFHSRCYIRKRFQSSFRDICRLHIRRTHDQVQNKGSNCDDRKRNCRIHRTCRRRILRLFRVRRIDIVHC